MNTNKFSMNKLFWGLLFIIGGFALIFDRMNLLPIFHHISLLSVIFTIFFIWMFLEGIRHKNFFAMIFALSFIAIQYDKVLCITAITPWTLLAAALLLSIGLTILFPHKGDQNVSHLHHKGNFIDSGSKTFDANDASVITFKNHFASSSKYINTDCLENASIENSFGEINVYFDNAIMKSGTAIVNVEVSFGEATLYLPKTWHIENHISCFLGDVTDNGTCISTGSPVLKLYGKVSFGEVSIVYI